MQIHLKKLYLILILFLLSIIVTTNFIFSYYQNREDINLLNLYELKFSKLIDSIEYDIDLTTIFLKDENFSNEELDSFFETIIDKNGYRNIALLPNGIVKYIYPLKNNQKVIGNNIFKNSLRKTEAFIAKSTKKTIFSGPYELTKDEIGIMIRKLIDEQEDLYIDITINKSELLKKLNLNFLKVSGYEYEFYSKVNNLDKIVFDKTSNFIKSKARYINIYLPNGHWSLGIHIANIYLKQFSISIIIILGIFTITFLYMYLELKKQNEINMKIEVTKDELTKLYNRKFLKEIQEKIKKDSIPYILYYIDLEKFKQINDRFGHIFGDQFLIAFSHELKRIYFNNFYIIRLGGDEFLVVGLYYSSLDDVLNYSIELENIKKLTFNDIPFKFNYGSLICDNKLTFDDNINLADKKMYENKNTNFKKEFEILENILTKKWSIKIIFMLGDQSLRFGALAKNLNCQNKVLIEHLSSLIQYNIIGNKKYYFDNKVESYYFLTDFGINILLVLKEF